MTTLGSNSFRPSLDVRQLDDKTMLARMEMPGVDKGDVNIQLRGKNNRKNGKKCTEKENYYWILTNPFLDNNLIVSGEKKSDYEENKEGFYRYESSFGSFQRSFPVGGGVKENDIKANLKVSLCDVFPSFI